MTTDLSKYIGASPSTCRMGEMGYPYDRRPYSQALAESGYKLGSSKLLHAAVSHGSVPMLGAWLYVVPKEKGKEMLLALKSGDRKKAYQLWMLGHSSEEIGEMFQSWSEVDWVKIITVDNKAERGQD